MKSTWFSNNNEAWLIQIVTAYFTINGTQMNLNKPVQDKNCKFSHMMTFNQRHVIVIHHRGGRVSRHNLIAKWLALWFNNKDVPYSILYVVYSHSKNIQEPIELYGLVNTRRLGSICFHNLIVPKYFVQEGYY